MVEAFEYNPALITDMWILWRKTGYLPIKEFDALIVMSEEQRHTFLNDLVSFESVVHMAYSRMTPLQKDKFQRLIATRQYDAARAMLDELKAKGNQEAAELRADMDITYPVTVTEKRVKEAAKWGNRILFGVLLFIAGVFVLSLVLMLLQR